MAVSKDALIHCPNCGTHWLGAIVADAKKVGAAKWQWDGRSWKCTSCKHTWKGHLLP